MKLGRKILFTILCVVGILSLSSVKLVAATTEKVSDGAGSIMVRFDANGGESDAADITVTYGNTYGELPKAIRENYVFKGWYTFRSGGSRVTTNTKIIKSFAHTLYAHWKGELTEITLDSNGGTLNMKKGNRVSSGDNQDASQNPDEETADPEGETDYSGSEGTDSEGKTQDTATVQVYYGSKILYQLPKPTKEGYLFDGWYTEASEGKKITVNSIFNEKSEKTLYAHWVEKQIKVIFIAFNGEQDEKYVAYGQAYGELPEPEREGYIFGGWYKKQDYTNFEAEAITADTIVKEPAQVKLLARWYIGDTSSE